VACNDFLSGNTANRKFSAIPAPANDSLIAARFSLPPRLTTNEVKDGRCVNDPDVDLIDWPTLYYKGNYARLPQAKARWDPLNVFEYRHSNALPGEAGLAS